MENDKFDRFLSNSLKVAEIEVDTPTNELEQMIIEKITVNKQKKRQKQFRVIQIAVAVILLLGISGAVLFPGQVYAIKKQLFQTIINIGKSVNINLNSGADQLQLQNQITGAVAAIQEDMPFEILIPRYIPPGFNLGNIEQSITDEQTKIIMTFVRNESIILFTQTIVSENFSSSVNIDAQEVKTQKVVLDKYEGNLITFNDGTATLIWVADDYIMCQLRADISSNQLVEIANSI